MKKNGFTLVEILASLFVITMIALITAPIALRVLNKSKKEAFEKSINGMIDAVRMHNAKQEYKSAIYEVNDGIITDEEGEKIKKNGGFKENGIIAIDEEGDITLTLANKDWCAKKEKEEKNITIKEYEGSICK